MMAVAIAAAMQRIPILHLHGGEVTYGNYDEFIRHSITKMSQYHFTSTEEYRKRVIQLGEDPKRVFYLGALGAENCCKIDEEKVQNRFFEQTAYVLDLTGETEKENLKELVLLRKLVNEKGKSLSVEESRKIQTQMENITNQRSKLTDMAYLMLFPEAEHEEWAQNLKNHGFYTFLEMPDTERYPWTKMFDLDEIRYALSGAELVKKEED